MSLKVSCASLLPPAWLHAGLMRLCLSVSIPVHRDAVQWVHSAVEAASRPSPLVQWAVLVCGQNGCSPHRQSGNIVPGNSLSQFSQVWGTSFRASYLKDWVGFNQLLQGPCISNMLLKIMLLISEIKFVFFGVNAPPGCNIHQWKIKVFGHPLNFSSIQIFVIEYLPLFQKVWLHQRNKPMEITNFSLLIVRFL